MKTSRDEACQALFDAIDAFSRITLFGCAVLTLLLFSGVCFLGYATDIPQTELIQVMTTLEVPADSWHADTKLLWWCLFLVVTGSLFAFGAFGFLNGFLTTFLRGKVAAIGVGTDTDPAQSLVPGPSLEEQIEDFRELFALAKATQHWVLGLLYCGIILGAPSLGLLGIRPSPMLWWGTALCAVFAAIGLVWNRIQTVGQTATNDRNAKVFHSSADKLTGGQG